MMRGAAEELCKVQRVRTPEFPTTLLTVVDQWSGGLRHGRAVVVVGESLLGKTWCCFFYKFNAVAVEVAHEEGIAHIRAILVGPGFVLQAANDRLQATHKDADMSVTAVCTNALTRWSARGGKARGAAGRTVGNTARLHRYVNI